MIPHGVEVMRDIPVGFDGRAAVDLYWHAQGKPTPVIVWIHGGGWMGGDRTDCGAALQLLDDGFAIASVEYRLSDEAAFPAQVHDCRRPIRWLRPVSHLYNIRRGYIGAWGASAGGHLAALLGTAKNALPERRHTKATAHAGRVMAVCDWFGPTDFLRMNDRPGAIDHDAPDSPESRLIGGPIRKHPDRVATANPATYVTADCPPFLIMHGADDDLVLPSQSRILHDALTCAGVESELIVLEGLGHGFGPDYPERVMTPVREFFRRHLRPRRH